ncbi:hypothetical protein [Actinomadura sp. WAC 06369]|uniref:hypothetical protein n=1 Tax=Actinomadura sp. WAC 06369 TaxID=2203193 RepID=UPI000F7758DB|nr:hypothetical protein [Actinomadura sp. WAC 06369]RSN70368.1 hypothetical protein DMH08_05785 [Actinomadura sp. WAC 06369]
MRGAFAREAAHFGRRHRALLAVFAVVLAGTVAYRIASGPNEVDWLPADAGRDWFAVCEGTAFTRAAPYAGPGPHPVKIFGAPSPGSGGEQDPDKPPASWDPRRADQVQLVACAELVEGGTEGRVECPRYAERYPLDPSGSPPEPAGYVSLMEKRYEVRLYEARTGEEVASWEVLGEDRSCPVSAYGAVLFSGILPSQWKRLLHEHVEGRAD